MSQPEEFEDLQKRETENGSVSDEPAFEANPGVDKESDDTGEQRPEVSTLPVDNPYGDQHRQQGYHPYTDSPYGNGNWQTPGGSPYTDSSYGNQNQQQGYHSYTGNPYGNGSQQTPGGSPYTDSPYGNQNQQQGYHPYTDSPYGNQPWNQQNRGNDPYRSQQTQNGSFYQQNQYSGQSPYQGNPYDNHQYSPYAAPARQNHTGWIIGIVAVIILLFLIVVFALTYKIISLYSGEREKARQNDRAYEYQEDREKSADKYTEENDVDPYEYDDGYGYLYGDDFGYGYPYGDDYGYGYPYGDDYGYGYPYGGDFGYGYPYGDDFDYGDPYGFGYKNGDERDYDNEQYYTLHDDIRTDLSYSIDFDYYEYDTDNENVSILVSYPVITGKNVPNREHLNDVIKEEITLLEEYYEEYAEYMSGEDSYFSGISSGYVTYMDEEKLSIVFSEYLYTDYYNDAFLYSINIDMENGIILNNENMLSIDDGFSVEFRKRSDIQNGEIYYLTGMTDQEITEYFNSSNIIVFYTPKGMEIGFNYEDGWVTVTYEEYEQYLKVF